MNRATIAVLANAIEQRLTSFSFKRIEPVPNIDSVEIVAAWKRKTFNSNRGIALAFLPDNEPNPGEFARAIKKAVGKKIGYIPFLYELALQLILVGSDIISEASNLEQCVDRINTQTVILQAIHIVDLDISNQLDGFPDDKSSIEATAKLPGWAQKIEFVHSIHTLGLGSGFARGKAKCTFSKETRKACLSARTWGQQHSMKFIDAVESGITEFVNQENT